MKRNNIFVIGLVIVLGLSFAYSQTLQLTVANQVLSGSTIKFDIYMQATSGTVYLGGADLVLTFNSTNFTTPACAKGTAATFTVTNPYYLADPVNNTTSAGGTPMALYRGLTVPAAISSNEIIINVNTPTIGDQPTFDSDVAVIDNNPYKFGTYTISTIGTPSGTFGLAWKTSGGGVVTKVKTFAPTTPWALSDVTLSTPAITDAPLPVEVTSFTASSNRLTAQLNWSTATEKNNYGFDVERRMMGNDATEWTKVGFVSGAGTKNSPTEYTYTDNGVAPGRYAYRIKQIDNDGAFKYASSAEVEIGLAAKVLSLSDAYPNPFNPTTMIEFTLPSDGRATLKVYNTIGQEVANLFDGVASAGRIIQGRFDAKTLATGLYFARLQFDGKTMLKKMLFVK